MLELSIKCTDCENMFTYQRTLKDGGRKRTRCDSCALSRKKESLKRAMDKHREKKGQKVGVGSGGNQRGENNPRWSGGHSQYRKTCFAHHGSSCYHCGSEENVVAHHLNEDRADGRPENLRPVCWRCHQTVEHDCSKSLDSITPEQRQVAESKRLRDQQGRYKSRSKTAEKTGEASRRGNPT